MDVSCCDKITFYFHYLKHKYSAKKYKSVIILNNDNTVFNNATQMFNSGVLDQNFFREPKKIIFRSDDEKVFNVTFAAKSYEDIKTKINLIILDYCNHPKKIKTAFPNFIENIYFIKDDNCIIDIKNVVDECIDYEKNITTFYDIALMIGENVKNIKVIKIVYFKTFKKIEKELKFSELMHNDIEMLNSIYNQ